MSKTLSRRDFLAASGALAGLGLYGCGGGGGNSGGGNSGGGEGGGDAAGVEGYDPELVAAAQAEGELVVIGTCEEPYIIAACDKYTELFGIKTSFQRLGGGEVLAKAQEENGNPSSDVWFGGGCTSYVQAANDGLLMKYSPANLSAITNKNFTSTDGTWVGIYFGILGFLYNMEQLEDNTSYMQDFQPLNEEEQDIITQATQVIRDAIAIPCTACHYCTEGCPQEIAIPEYFSLYNIVQQFPELKSNSKRYYDLVAKSHGKASECLECGQCEAQCPQHIDIIDNLKLLVEAFETP